MGGRFGDGPIKPDRSEEVGPFAHPWHARALGLTLAVGSLGQWSIDESRHSRECLPPKDYIRFTYYERWIAALAGLLVDRELITEEELSGRVQPRTSDQFPSAITPDEIRKLLMKGNPANRASEARQRFGIGEKVVTLRPAGNRFRDGGHTRLPVYAAGCEGTILAFRGCHVLPDANAHGLGEAPEPLYSVAFRSGDLWPCPDGHPDDEVVLDLWESYLRKPG